MTERENILARVREALKSPTSHSGTHGPPQPATSPSANNSRQWLPPVGKSLQEQIELFRKNTADLKTDFYLVSDWLEASEILKKLQEQENWQRIGVHKGELTEAACEVVRLPACRTD